MNSAATSEATTLLRAVRFAAHRHRFQRRKDTDATPYINHPIEVASVLAEIGGVCDVTTLVAAVLHDTIEDTETTADEVEREFGSDVRHIVEEMTDDKSLPKEERKRLQIERSSHTSLRAKLVKLADKICNVRDVGQTPPKNWSLARRLEYLEWTEKVIVGCRGTNERLEQCYDEALRSARVRFETDRA